MIKRGNRRAAAAVLCIAAALIVLGIVCIPGGHDMGILGRLFGRETVITSDLAAYVSDIAGVQVEDLCTGEAGEVTVSSSEEYAYICLSLSEGGCETVRERMETAGAMPLPEAGSIPGYGGHELAARLRAEDISYMYSLFAAGKGKAKTRSVELYLTTDEQGQEHLYLFG